jgi:hypothetical protein
MKTENRVQLTLDQIITAVELFDDQLQDLRAKLRHEIESNRPDDWIKFRLSVITHYRNAKINLLNKVDSDLISRREIIGLLHNN